MWNSAMSLLSVQRQCVSVKGVTKAAATAAAGSGRRMHRMHRGSSCRCVTSAADSDALTATSLRSANVHSGTATALLLSASDDLICKRMMCEHVGNVRAAVTTLLFFVDCFAGFPSFSWWFCLCFFFECVFCCCFLLLSCVPVLLSLRCPVECVILLLLSCC